MQSNSFFSIVGEFLINVSKFLLPVAILGCIAYGILFFSPMLSSIYAFYSAIAVSLSALFIAFYLYHTSRNIYFAYGAGVGATALLYASVYYAYVAHALFMPYSAFWILTVIILAMGYVAIRFQGWLLAMLGVAMGISTPALLLVSLPRPFLAWYFVVLQLIVMIVAYYRRWLELPVLAFLGFLLYNSTLFRHTDFEGTKGFLSIYQVLELMVAIFIIYTAIPWLYSLCCPKKRIFEAISITIGGAYTAAIIHFVIQSQLSLVAQLPFYIRFFVSKGAPVMNDVYLYIFAIYGGIYLVLFILLFLINHQAKTTLAILACLIVICMVGIMYTHSKATGLLPAIIDAKKLVDQVVQQVKA